MQAIRQIYEDAPDAIPVPEAFRHRRLEVLLIVEEEYSVTIPTKITFGRYA